MSAQVDLNADLGESFGRWTLGNDEAMLALVTSANIACGFHAGDATTLRLVCAQAAERGVAVGAQVSYRDMAGFGRRFIDISAADLTNDVLYQLGALDALCRVSGSPVRYVKPHGALYNTVVHHEAQAAGVVEAVRLYDASLPLICMPGSVLIGKAEEAGLRTVTEAFADRAYAPDGTLVPRSHPGALLHDPQQVAERVARMVTTGRLMACDGSEITVRAESICVHGDSPGAVQMAEAVRRALAAEGVDIKAFVS